MVPIILVILFVTVCSSNGMDSKVQTGNSTRYWDCCKPSCSWDGKANVSKPVQACSFDGYAIEDKDTQSVCNGGSAYTCNNNIPWAINNKLSYGFVGANIVGKSEKDWCCACYELTFTSDKVVGKKMIVQVTNTGGDLNANQFNIQIPGGGFGRFSDGCSNQWGISNDEWGAYNGGVWSRSECNKLPYEIRAGCRWRFDWFEGADNPSFEFVGVKCPTELTSKTGCVRAHEPEM